MTRCSAIKADGGRCGAPPMSNSEWCFNHHPDQAEARKLRASKGGKRAGRGRPLLEVHDIGEQLQDLVDRVLSGELDKGTAAVVGQLLNYRRAVISTVLDVKRTTEMELRMAEIEERLAKSGRGA